MNTQFDTQTNNIAIHSPKLIAAGLIYLAIPNMLFLMGWFTPWVALGGIALISVFVTRAIVLQCRANKVAAGCTGLDWRYSWAVSGCILAVVLVFLSGGIVGVVDTAWDYSVYRQALFCNLRDAPWPLVLPNGGEMTYYIANVLPSALMARALPDCLGQWCIVVWTCIPIMLSLLLVTSAVQSRFKSKAVALWAVFAIVLLIRDPFWMIFSGIYDPIQRKVLYAMSFLPYDFSFLCRPAQSVILTNAFRECLGAYNSTPCVMLAATLMVTCRTGAKYMVPLVMTLLAALTPLGTVGLFPLAAYLFFRAWKKSGFKILPLLPECVLPAFLLCVVAVYFCRTESPMIIAFGVSDQGLVGDMVFFLRILIVWLLVVYPLWKVVGKDPLFRLIALVILFGQMVFVGTLHAMNEFWLKFSPAYVLLLGMYYASYWQKVHKIKYYVFAACGLNVLLIFALHLSHIGNMPYGVVADDYNGHMNHDHKFLHRMIPETKEPMLPGVLLRESGESETCFPGCILPKAPGCDYSRPLAEKTE